MKYIELFTTRILSLNEKVDNAVLWLIDTIQTWIQRLLHVSRYMLMTLCSAMTAWGALGCAVFPPEVGGEPWLFGDSLTGKMIGVLLATFLGLQMIAITAVCIVAHYRYEAFGIRTELFKRGADIHEIISVCRVILVAVVFRLIWTGGDAVLTQTMLFAVVFSYLANGRDLDRGERVSLFSRGAYATSKN